MIAILMTLAFVLATLGVTAWASRRSTGAASFFAAGRNITAWQNGLAVAGDYMSAASFLGITGLIAYYGYDGFMYSVGFLVAYLTVLLIVAEPLRNSGKYTIADVLAFRLSARPVRAMAALSTLTIGGLYMIAQMVGAGAMVSLLMKETGIDFRLSVASVGTLMIVYVVFGGMLATTWVQIIKAILLMAGVMLLSLLVLAQFDFSVDRFFASATHITYLDRGQPVTRDFLQPGLYYKPPYGALNLISLSLALILGTAGLPHILVRFYTVPDAKTARFSVVWAMAIIGFFYILTTFLGFGSAILVGRSQIASNGGINMSAPLLAHHIGGDLFLAFIAAVTFATILAVVAGLAISASTSVAHDFYSNVLRAGKPTTPAEEVRVARFTAVALGAGAVAVAILLGPGANVAFLVGLAFAVAASANLPAIVLSLFWKRFNTAGAVAGMGAGLAASIALILAGPSFQGARAWFPLENPGIVSIPVGFLAAIAATLLSPDRSSEQKYNELLVRSSTGLGAERASSH
ncbi:MAG: cation/acetate symporter ActP [Acidobacteria bacterium]|nr:cation/acetate symporter ActP [Acidobacteriota bacterium]